jgi:mannose-1-phosphate guanylyltransferase/phosphomannomutase
MRALVLAAGLGTRLHPLTRARAKAAAPVDGEPLVRRTIRWLVAHGLTDLVVNLHHQPETIASVVGDGSDLGARVRYSWESRVLGSAGGPRHALPLLLDGAAARTVVIVNGDTLTNVDLAAMIDHHRRHGALVTMALIPNPRPDKYGGVLLDADGAVAGFTRRGSAAASFHFIGPQIVEAEAFLSLDDGVPAETVLALYPQLIAQRPGSIAGFVSDATFHDIGTPADLLQTSLDLAALDGRPGAPRWGRDVAVASTARVTRCVLWDRITIGDGATLTDCVVADDVVIPGGAVFQRCAIVHDNGALTAVNLD